MAPNIAVFAQTQQYIYDEAGNVVEIRRLAAGELAILAFAPTRGAIGNAVTIQGQGFNGTLGSNTVKFNGVTAVLIGGSTTQLTATVPPGATSGPISVSNGSATVTSVRSFAVTVGPSISSFTPSVGTPGTAVTITGTNFDPLPLNDRISFNGTTAVVAGATTTALSTTVPSAATSGPISVTTPMGSKTSAADFFVPPGSSTSASVGFTGRIALGGAALPVSVPAGKMALLLLTGSAGDPVTLYLDSLTGTFVPVTLYGTGNTLIGSGSATSAQPWTRLPVLPYAGTFTLVLNGSSGAFSTSLRATLAPLLVIGGSAPTTTFSVAGQPKRLAFSGIAGQNLGFGYTNGTLTPATGYFVIELLRPDATVMQTGYCYLSGDSCSGNLTVPTTGTYSLWLVPPAGATGSLQTWATADLTATLTAGTAYTLTTTRAGRNARLSFTGTAGPAPAIEFGAVTTNPGAQYLSAAVYKPDGSLLTSKTIPPAGETWTMPTLPTPGTYLLSVEPLPSQKGAATITSARITIENGSALTIDGAATTGTFPTAGESSRFTFNATSGQRLGLGFTGLSLTPTSVTSAAFTVFRPDGSVYATANCYTNGDYCSMNLAPDVTGKHSIVVQPASSATGSVQGWLSTDSTGVLSIGTAATIATTRSGQNASRTFTGSAGQLLRLSVSAVSTSPANQYVNLTVVKPDGTTLLTTSTATAPYSIDVPALPVAGTYKLFLEPLAYRKGAATFSMTTLLAVR